jgi:hypothetical protein
MIVKARVKSATLYQPYIGLLSDFHVRCSFFQEENFFFQQISSFRLLQFVLKENLNYFIIVKTRVKSVTLYQP